MNPIAFGSALCPSHQQAAIASCVRCGTFLCGECTELVGEAAYCASCMAFVGKHAAPSLFLKMALGLEVIAFAFIPIAILPPLQVVSLLRIISVLSPVLNVLAAGLGFGAVLYERRRLGRAGLQPSASRWLRWVHAGAWLHLGYVLLLAFLVFKSVRDYYDPARRP